MKQRRQVNLPIGKVTLAFSALYRLMSPDLVTFRFTIQITNTKVDADFACFAKVIATLSSAATAAHFSLVQLNDVVQPYFQWSSPNSSETQIPRKGKKKPLYNGTCNKCRRTSKSVSKLCKMVTQNLSCGHRFTFDTLSQTQNIYFSQPPRSAS